jgi:hypothetical protein
MCSTKLSRLVAAAVLGLAVGAAVLAGFAGTAKAFPGQTIFVTTTAGPNSCPPPFLGGFPIRQVGPDTRTPADGTFTENDGQVAFTADGGPLGHYAAYSSFNNWSNDYGWGNGGPAEFCNFGFPVGTGVVTNPAGDVYVNPSGTDDTVDIWLPFQTQAFQFYAEANLFGTWTVTAYDQSGQATTSLPVTSPFGAQYFGFWTIGGPYTLRHVHVACVGGCGGFGMAIGEFGLALQKLARAS